ncbi:hypothetical protein SCLCIDRAFT_723447 [Scleroderma citrinum Foug A]|uniref:Uncharacterized protein n=1 Tax=Scleroderma citrinum Foug A TaxID=1036808 RepID=A0A0C3AXN2_9AGAM|nr:hypothetical protein SCLCIDRAFT_723447 [Scleroderma citrinum Foug A]
MYNTTSGGSVDSMQVNEALLASADLRRHLLAASLIFGIEGSLDVVKRESFVDQLSGGAPVFQE